MSVCSVQSNLRRVDSVFFQIMVICMCSIDLSNISKDDFYPQHTGSITVIMTWDSRNYNSNLPLVFLSFITRTLFKPFCCRKLMYRFSKITLAHIVPVLLQHVLKNIPQCFWMVWLPNLSYWIHLEHDMMIPNSFI